MRESWRAEKRLKELYKDLEQAEKMYLINEGERKERDKIEINKIKEAIVVVVRNLME